MDLLRIAVRIQHLHPIDGLRALVQARIKSDDSLETAVVKKRYNTFLSGNSIGELQRIANTEFKLSTYDKCEGTAAQQLTALRSRGFQGLQHAEHELGYIENLASQTRGKYARAELQELINDFRREAASGFGYWKSRLEQAKTGGNRTEMELAATWLGGMTLRNVLAELGVSADAPQNQPIPPDASHKTISEAFKLAAETHDFTHSQLKQLEDWAVAKFALPTRPETTDAPYAAGDFPPLSRAAESTNLLLAQAELSKVMNAVAAPPTKPEKTPLLCLLADLQARVTDTLLHWGHQRAQLVGEQDIAPTSARAAEIETITRFLGLTVADDDLDSVSESGSEDDYVTEISRPDLDVTAPFSHMSATESFAMAMEMDQLTDAHTHQLVSSFVNRHLLPDRPVQGTPYDVTELPDPYKLETAPSLATARADLHDVRAIIEASTDENAEPRLLPALRDLQARVDAAETAWQKL